jgi:hypothetical protein
MVPASQQYYRTMALPWCLPAFPLHSAKLVAIGIACGHKKHPVPAFRMQQYELSKCSFYVSGTAGGKLGPEHGTVRPVRVSALSSLPFCCRPDNARYAPRRLASIEAASIEDLSLPRIVDQSA